MDEVCLLELELQIIRFLYFRYWSSAILKKKFQQTSSVRSINNVTKTGTVEYEAVEP